MCQKMCHPSKEACFAEMRREYIPLSNFTAVSSLTEILGTPGFANCTERVLEQSLIYGFHKGNDEKSRKQQLQEKARSLVSQCVGSLNSLNDTLHELMVPGLDKELGLQRVPAMLDLLNSRIVKQDTDKWIKKSGPVTPLPSYDVVFIDTAGGVGKVVDKIIDSHHPRAEAPIIYVDLEGFELGRNGTLCMLQIYMPRVSTVYLLDVHTLSDATFHSSGTLPYGRTGATWTLKDILESTDIRKAFWDCRKDSDALFSHFNVRLDATAVDDVQLLDLASLDDQRRRKKVKSLDMAVDCRIHLPQDEADEWKATKKEIACVIKEGPNWRQKLEMDTAKAKAICDGHEDHGAPGEVNGRGTLTQGDLVDDGWEKSVAWEQRPLPEQMLKYACGDVIILPILYRHFAGHDRYTALRRKAVQEETARRILGSQAEVLMPFGNDAPQGWSDREW